MDKPNLNGVSELIDEQVDAISGGYILDLCGMNIFGKMPWTPLGD